MIYPKAIFRTVIALSTVAATTQATVASPRSSTNGAKRGKGGRYVDTNADFYDHAAAHGAAYASGELNPQQGTSLRKVTSPNTTNGKFSYASPTNSAGVVTLLERSETTDFFLVQRPRSNKDVGGKRNTGKGGVVADVNGLVGDYVTKGARTVQSDYNSGGHNNNIYGNNDTGGERSTYGRNQRTGKKSSRSKKGGHNGGANGGAYRLSPGGIYNPVNSPTGSMYVPPAPANQPSYSSNTGGNGSQKTGQSNGGSKTGGSGSNGPVQNNTGSSYGSNTGSNTGNTGGNGSQKTGQSNGGSKTGGSGSNGPVQNNTGSSYGSNTGSNTGNTGGNGSQKTGQSNGGSKTGQSNGGSKTGGSGSNVQSSNSGSTGGPPTKTTLPSPYGSTGSGSKSIGGQVPPAPVATPIVLVEPVEPPTLVPIAAPVSTPAPQTLAPKPSVTPCAKHKKGKQSRRN